MKQKVKSRTNEPILKKIETGTLYIVSTPIGNLEDITLRAIRILKEVDLILCEDTRTTVKLLNKYEIKTRLKAFHKFNERSQTEEITETLISGKNIAIVSDAGTPTISDPGFELVKSAREKDLRVFPIPGPSALISAISTSGKIKNDFLFAGFLPGEKNKRIELIKSFQNKSSAIIIYIAPHDLVKYLREFSDIYPTSEIFIHREITKLHEEYIEGQIHEVINTISNKEIKGEIVLGVLINAETKENKTSDKEILELVSNLTKEGFGLKEASKIAGKKFNIPNSFIYNLYIKKFERNGNN